MARRAPFHLNTLAILSLTLLVLLALLSSSKLSHAQTLPQGQKPFRLPLEATPGPNSWLVGQFYGNTTEAYNFHERWYSAGQRLHFGLDMYAPCGTPVVAVADGDVHAVDAPSFGSGPHNVIIRHFDLGLVTLYGHLFAPPPVLAGQPVVAGQVIGYVGDSQGVCSARPHLHFEVRSPDFRTAYNPTAYIDAPWDVLAGIGPLAQPQFQQDMYNVNRWMSVELQPDVTFGGAPLNNYNRSRPALIQNQAPRSAEPARLLPPPSDNAQWTLQPLGSGGCCSYPWFENGDSSNLYVIDGIIGERASVFRWGLNDNARQIIEEAPPANRSADGRYQVARGGNGVEIIDTSNNARWGVNTDGNLPSISPNNSQLLWQVYESNIIPREPFPIIRTYVSDLNGANKRKIWEQGGGWVAWLDDARVLIITPFHDQSPTQMSIYDTRDNTHFILGTYDWVREISLSPGGDYILFFVIWQSDPNASGVYALQTQFGALPQKMPWFGSWRWRDSESVYFIPFEQAWFNRGAMALSYYNIRTGAGATLTSAQLQPFTIANGDWVVSPDGGRIAFKNAQDGNTWLLQATP